MAISKKENGHPDSYFQKFTVSNTTYPDTPQVIVAIKYIVGFSLLAESGTIFYSTNGNYDSGQLISGSASGGFIWDNRPMNLLWLRVDSGSATVRVEAWQGR